jgi:hypothetical protein
MKWREKIELSVKLAGEPGEEQVRQLLARASHVSIERDCLGNWQAYLVDHGAQDFVRLFYQNAGSGDTNQDEDGPISLCRSWDPIVPEDNEADLRLSPEWGSLACGVLHDIAACARQVLERELGQRWANEYVSQYSVVVAATPSGPCRSLFEVARDDPTVLPVLRDKVREELP